MTRDRRSIQCGQRATKYHVSAKRRSVLAHKGFCTTTPHNFQLQPTHTPQVYSRLHWVSALGPPATTCHRPVVCVFNTRPPPWSRGCCGRRPERLRGTRLEFVSPHYSALRSTICQIMTTLSHPQDACPFSPRRAASIASGAAARESPA